MEQLIKVKRAKMANNLMAYKKILVNYINTLSGKCELYNKKQQKTNYNRIENL